MLLALSNHISTAEELNLVAEAQTDVDPGHDSVKLGTMHETVFPQQVLQIEYGSLALPCNFRFLETLSLPMAQVRDHLQDSTHAEVAVNSQPDKLGEVWQAWSWTIESVLGHRPTCVDYDRLVLFNFDHSFLFLEVF